MRKNNAKNLLYLAILTSAVVLTWIGTTIYYSLSTSTIPMDTSKYSTPIDPAFDMTILDSLNSRTVVPVDFSQKGVYETDTISSESAQPIEETFSVPPPSLDSPTIPPVVTEQTGSSSGTIESDQPVETAPSQ